MSELIKYFSVDCCIKCNWNLGFDKKMYSGGTCPNCGNTNRSTVVDCFKRLAVKVQINSRWKFWLKTYEYSWADEYKLEKESNK